MGVLAKISGIYLAGIAVALAVGLSILWCFWSLWCYVLPQIYPAGPPAVVAPGYWLFVCFWLLLTWLGRVLFGRTSTTTASAG